MNRRIGDLETMLWLPALLTVTALAQAPDSCLHYEPAAVSLEGTLFYELDYGPPNYGEDPKTDEKGYYPMIRLAQPVTVCGDPKSDINVETERNVREIQLVFMTSRVPPRGNGGRHVVVTGTLYHSHTGHHYRPVLVSISTFRFAAAPRRGGRTASAG